VTIWGLLLCFGCSLDPELQKKLSAEKRDVKLDLVNYVRDQIKLTPLEILANAIKQYGVPKHLGDELFGRKISQAFEQALDLLFFENPKLAPLTRKYGVF
jgi:hypothetical protein